MKRYTSIAAVARHDAFGCVQTRWLGYSRGDGRERHCTGFTEGEHFARPFTSLFRCAIDDATSIAADERHDAFGCVVTRWLGYSRADGRERHCTGFTEGEHFARPFTSLFRCAIDDATRIERSRRTARCVWLRVDPLAGLQLRRDGRAGTSLSWSGLCVLVFFLRSVFRVTRSKHVGGGGPAADL